MAGIACFVVTAVFLQVTNSFHFYYIEQLQLFRYAADYWIAQLSEVGGAAALRQWREAPLSFIRVFPSSMGKCRLERNIAGKWKR